MFFFFLKQFLFFKQAKNFFNVFKKSFVLKKEKNLVKEKEKSASGCLPDGILWAYLAKNNEGWDTQRRSSDICLNACTVEIRLNMGAPIRNSAAMTAGTAIIMSRLRPAGLSAEK
jgi:hypothetical protein